MILTCPECATRYNVDESRLGPQGRTVRCTSCANSWRAEAPAQAPLELKPSVRPPPEPPRPAPSTVHGQFRAKVEAKRRTREAVAAGVVWGVLAAAFAVLMIATVVFRGQVVRLWPRTAGAYAAVKMPVNPLGVAPENVQAVTGLEHGHMALVVTGQQRNVDSASRPGAPMRISILDKAGHPLAAKVLRPTPGQIAPGDSRPFKVSFYDPPLTGATVGVDFVFDPAPVRAKPPPPHLMRAKQVAVSTPLKLRGASAMPERPAPEARPAESLPVDPRYALPSAARAEAEVAPKLRPRD